MKVQVTAKRFKLNDWYLTRLQKGVQKISRLVDSYNFGSGLLKILISPQAILFYPKHLHRHHYSNFTNRMADVTKYTGQLKINLPGQNLIVYFSGQSIDQAFGQGFKRLIREIEKYKQLHFKSFSQYPDHRSVRFQYISNRRR